MVFPIQEEVRTDNDPQRHMGSEGRPEDIAPKARLDPHGLEVHDAGATCDSTLPSADTQCMG